MPRFRNYKKNAKDKELKRGRYRSGEGPDEVTFVNEGPKDIKASYGEKVNTEYSPGFQKRAFKDLAFGQVTLKVNPETEAGYLADPYAIIGPTNKVIDAYYVGKDNTSGSVCPQLANGSTSNLLDMPDCLTLRLEMNYNYAKHTTSDNACANMNKAYFYPWAEVDSSIKAEAFYELPFFSWAVTGQNSGDLKYQDGLLDILDYYQTVLQAVYQVPLRYKVIRSLEKTLKDMCYMNGSEILNDIYGKLKKATFIAAVNGLSSAINDHFFDRDWFDQTAYLIAQPSRKAKGMVDPLLLINTRYKFNTGLEVADGQGSPLFTTHDTDLADIATQLDTIDAALDVENLLHMARTNANLSTLNTWFLNLVNAIDALKNDLTTFTKDFADLVVAFKRMDKAHLTDWKLGSFMLVDKINEGFEPVFNKLNFDIFRSCFTGARDITYDSSLNQWKSYTIWDKYIGIPTYDQFSGGSTLTFSTKKIVNSSGITTLMWPVWFNMNTSASYNYCSVITRTGTIYPITLQDVQVNSGAIARVIGRLSPLSNLNTVYFHIPYVDISTISSYPLRQSWITEMIQHVFGYGKICVATGVYDYAISDDILTSVDFIVDDQTNACDTTARQKAPFKVFKAVTEQVLGIKNNSKIA